MMFGCWAHNDVYFLWQVAISISADIYSVGVDVRIKIYRKRKNCLRIRINLPDFVWPFIAFILENCRMLQQNQPNKTHETQIT